MGVIVLAGVVAVVAGRDRGDDVPAGVSQTRPVEVTGDPLPPFESAGGDPARGMAAPEVRGARFDGRPLSIVADGRPKVLVFLAHWCPHCQREVPVLAAWMARNGLPRDVDVYGIATATSPDRPNYPPSAWLERERFDAPTLADDAAGSAGRAFGLSGFPFFVVVDRDNRVVTRASGELDTAGWEALLDAARRG
jgi:thiol-disulfide isomerase/thioredoxin